MAALLLKGVRFALLPLPMLNALSQIEPSEPFRMAVSKLAASAKRIHNGHPEGSNLKPPTRPTPRGTFPYWWGILGSGVPGGTVIAGKGSSSNERIAPRAVRLQGELLYILDAAKEPGNVWQWSPKEGKGQCIAGEDKSLVFKFEDIADICPRPDDGVMVLDRDLERVVLVQNGVGLPRRHLDKRR